MKVATEDIPSRIDRPDAVPPHRPDVDDATNYGTLAVEKLTVPRGTDITALLEGLEHDRYQSPHQGYVVSGALTATDTDDSEELDEAGTVVSLPPGHPVPADEDTDFVRFSPPHEHGEVIDHIRDNTVSTGGHRPECTM